MQNIFFAAEEFDGFVRYHKGAVVVGRQKMSRAPFNENVQSGQYSTGQAQQ